MDTDLIPRLLGDVGGTHARFAWQDGEGAPLAEVATYPCARYGSLLEAIRHYLDERGKTAPRQCAIGIANPVTGDRVQMTNHHWSFSISELKRQLGLERLVVINDFTALALALPALSREDLRPIGQGSAAAGAPLAVLGPGTGLGVSGLLPALRGRFVPVSGEGGHVSLAAGDEREAAVVARLRQRFGHASAERALSGPGLVNLYEAACTLAGRSVETLGPADVIARARGGDDRCCVAALDLFFGFLGSVAGDLALTLGARGGVYIGGGVVPRLVAELERSTFRERFESKGRFRDYLCPIPTFVIDA
jgi:glucokinase